MLPAYFVSSFKQLSHRTYKMWYTVVFEQSDGGVPQQKCQRSWKYCVDIYHYLFLNILRQGQTDIYFSSLLVLVPDFFLHDVTTERQVSTMLTTSSQDTTHHLFMLPQSIFKGCQLRSNLILFNLLL